jgi:hypothetical protein
MRLASQKTSDEREQNLRVINFILAHSSGFEPLAFAFGGHEIFSTPLRTTR